LLKKKKLLKKNFGRMEQRFTDLLLMLVPFYIEEQAEVGHYFRTSKLLPYKGLIPIGDAEPIDYFITIIYDDLKKNIDIQDIKNDKAYKVLTVLFDPYPIKTNIKIPIDVYIYKNTIYPDLESTDFSKVEGYEEALSIINKNRE